MKNHELLDMIGDVNEDYVRAADSNVVRPRFRWKALAACAACAALIAVAWPAPAALDSDPPLEQTPETTQDPARTLVQAPGLHDYILVEQDMHIQTTQGEVKAPSGSLDETTVMPGGAYVAGKGTYTESGEDVGGDIDGTYYNPPGQDIPVDEEPYFQYERLLQALGGQDGREPDVYPEWFAGSWTDHSGGPDAPARLAVAIVEGFRTPGLEAQINGWCGGTGEILLIDAKYSYNYLDSLMDGITQIFEAHNVHIPSVYGVYVMDNYLGLDFYGDAPSDEILSALAELDPSGDAILIQVFYGGQLLPTTQSEKGPAPVPVPNEERAEPALDPEDFPTPIDMSDEPAEASTAPGGPAGSLPARTEDGHDIPGASVQPPQAKYDAIYGADD